MDIVTGLQKTLKKVTMRAKKTYKELAHGKKTKQKKKKATIEAFEKNLHHLTKNHKKKQTENRDTISFTTKSIFMFWLVGALVYYLGYVAFEGLHIIYLILTGLIIAIAMESVIRFWSRWTKRGVAIALAYLCLVIFVLLGLIIIIPFTIQQTKELLDMLLNQVHLFQAELATQGLETMIINAEWIPSFLQEPIVSVIQEGDILTKVQQGLQKNISEIVSFGTNYATWLSEVLISFFGGFVNFLIETMIVLTLAVLFTIEKNSVIRFLSRIGGEQKQDVWKYKIETLYKKLGTWLQGQLLLCLIIGVVVWLALTIMGWFGLEIPNAASLGLIAGLTEFVPYLGPILGAIPALLVATTTHGFLGFAVVGGLFILIQRSENDILIPRIMNRTLGVNAVVIFISMLIGGVALGFLGVLLAVPIAVIITLLFDDEFE